MNKTDRYRHPAWRTGQSMACQSTLVIIETFIEETQIYKMAAQSDLYDLPCLVRSTHPFGLGSKVPVWRVVKLFMTSHVLQWVWGMGKGSVSHDGHYKRRSSVVYNTSTCPPYYKARVKGFHYHVNYHEIGLGITGNMVLVYSPMTPISPSTTFGHCFPNKIRTKKIKYLFDELRMPIKRIYIKH